MHKNKIELHSETQDHDFYTSTIIYSKNPERGQMIDEVTFCTGLIEGLMSIRRVLVCNVPQNEMARRYHAPPRASGSPSTCICTLAWHPMAMLPEDAVVL
jgi:hypothetical protein